MAEAADRLEAETKRNRFFTLALDMLGHRRTSTGTSSQLNPSWERDPGLQRRGAEGAAAPRVRPRRRPREATAEQLARLRARATPITYFENRFASKAGGYRWLGWTAAPFAEEGLVYIFARDLTETRAGGGGAGQAHPRADGARGRGGLGAPGGLPGRGGHRARRVPRLRGDPGQARAPGRARASADWCLIDVLEEHGRGPAPGGGPRRRGRRRTWRRS